MLRENTASLVFFDQDRMQDTVSCEERAATEEEKQHIAAGRVTETKNGGRYT